MLESFISDTLFFFFFFFYVENHLPNPQSPKILSPKILCHSLQKKKTYLDTTSLIKLWKHSIQRESFNLAPMSSQNAFSTNWWYWCSTTFPFAVVGCIRMYTHKKCNQSHKRVYFDTLILSSCHIFNKYLLQVSPHLEKQFGDYIRDKPN
jgi:hypothetical protein